MINALKNSCALRIEFERLRDMNNKLAKLQGEIEHILETELNRTEEDATERLKILSEKEREVFDLIAEGLKPIDISTRLGRTKKTIETQRTTIVGKLNLQSVKNLEAFAKRTKP